MSMKYMNEHDMVNCNLILNRILARSNLTSIRGFFKKVCKGV